MIPGSPRENLPCHIESRTIPLSSNISRWMQTITYTILTATTVYFAEESQNKQDFLSFLPILPTVKV